MRQPELEQSLQSPSTVYQGSVLLEDNVSSLQVHLQTSQAHLNSRMDWSRGNWFRHPPVSLVLLTTLSISNHPWLWPTPKIWRSGMPSFRKGSRECKNPSNPMIFLQTGQLQGLGWGGCRILWPKVYKESSRLSNHPFKWVKGSLEITGVRTGLKVKDHSQLGTFFPYLTQTSPKRLVMATAWLQGAEQSDDEGRSVHCNSDHLTQKAAEKALRVRHGLLPCFFIENSFAGSRLSRSGGAGFSPWPLASRFPLLAEVI